MKKRPIHKYDKETGSKPFLGTLASESAQRQQAWLQTGCNAFDSAYQHSSPLSFWLEQDVLQYIKTNNLQIASVYGEVQEKDGKLFTTGLDRTGCMFCMFGAHLEKCPNRFQKMAHTHPSIYEYCLKPKEEHGLGLKEVLDYLKIPY